MMQGVAVPAECLICWLNVGSAPLVQYIHQCVKLHLPNQLINSTARQAVRATEQGSFQDVQPSFFPRALQKIQGQVCIRQERAGPQEVDNNL
jgi:hypothetical protein